MIVSKKNLGNDADADDVWNDERRHEEQRLSIIYSLQPHESLHRDLTAEPDCGDTLGLLQRTVLSTSRIRGSGGH